MKHIMQNMASKKGSARSYFGVVSEKKKKTGSTTFPIQPIVVAETNEASQGEADMTTSQVKKTSYTKKKPSNRFRKSEKRSWYCTFAALNGTKVAHLKSTPRYIQSLS